MRFNPRWVGSGGGMRVSLATFPHLNLLLRLRPGSNIVGSIMGGSRNCRLQS